jgi:hypothetical protein
MTMHHSRANVNDTLVSVCGPYGAAAPAFDKATSSFALRHPHGLSVRDLQALSSEGPAWHSSPQSEPSALAIGPPFFLQRRASCTQSSQLSSAIHCIAPTYTKVSSIPSSNGFAFTLLV